MNVAVDLTAQARRLRMAIARKNLTQLQVATALGVIQPTVSEILCARRPGRPQLQKLATLLDVPLEWITTGVPRQEWEGAFEPVTTTGSGSAVTGGADA